MTVYPATTHYLCICADDFGMSPGINAAVLDLIEQRKLSATGCLVRRGEWKRGLPVLRRVNAEHVDVGLHLDLTPTLPPGCDDSGFGSLLLRTFTRTASRRRLQVEIADQLARFEDGMGRQPAFVDGHRHVHQLPVVRHALMDELAGRYGGHGAAPPWLRSTRPRPARGASTFKAYVIHALGGRALAKEAARNANPTSRALLGVYDFAGDHVGYKRRMHGWLSAARSGDVLMCHPSLGDWRATPHDAARIAEHSVLASIAFPWITPTGDFVALAPISAHVLREGTWNLHPELSN